MLYFNTNVGATLVTKNQVTWENRNTLGASI